MMFAYFVCMSVKIRFEKGPLVVQHILKDQALRKLMELVIEEGEDGVGSFQMIDSESQPSARTPQTAPPTPAATEAAQFPEKRAKEWLAKHSAGEVLSAFKWDTWAEKILALGAYYESKAGEDFESWRSSDIIECFTQTRTGEPTNFPRDISVAIKSTWIAPVTARTYKVSFSGWRKVADAIAKAVEATIDAKVLANYQQTTTLP